MKDVVPGKLLWWQQADEEMKAKDFYQQARLAQWQDGALPVAAEARKSQRRRELRALGAEALNEWRSTEARALTQGRRRCGAWQADKV